MSFVNNFLHINRFYMGAISCKIEVLPIVVDCCLPPLLPAAATVAAAAAAPPVSVTVIHHLCHCLRLSFASRSSWTSSHCNWDGCPGRRRRQKGAPCIQRGRRRQQCEGVNNDDRGLADFADAKLVDNRGTLLPPPLLGISQGAPPSRRGEKEMEEDEDVPLATPAGCCDASRCTAAASRPLGAPPPLVR